MFTHTISNTESKSSMCGDNFSLGYKEVPVVYANKNSQDSLDQSHLYLRERGRERERGKERETEGAERRGGESVWLAEKIGYSLRVCISFCIQLWMGRQCFASLLSISLLTAKFSMELDAALSNK